MLGIKKEGGSARKAFFYSGLQLLALAIVMKYSLNHFNKSDIAGERIYDPIIGIILAAIMGVGFFTIVYLHYTRTDEHDRMANLWACTFALLTFGIMNPIWNLLHDSGVLGPANPKTAFVISLTIGSMVWVWHKFR